jgi:zinc protease
VVADPEIRFGTLPNGLRYAIKRQAVPAGQAAVRLWIGAGSLEETDAQQGLAHFLEHMAFDGSKAVPEGEMIKILERHGLAFGPDTNASTSYEQTIYKLDLPKTDADTVDTSLMLLREAAGNLTIAPDAVGRERGAVLSEERLRDTPSYRVFKSRLGFFLPGQRLPTRHPIGKVGVIQQATDTPIKAFYRAYYRPERAALVAVGDFDPAGMEAKIRARFGDWQGEGPAGADPDLGKVASRGPEAKLDVEPGLPLFVNLAWIRPADLSPDSVAKRRRELVKQLGLQVLNRRFSVLARGGTPPFLGAAASKSDFVHSADITDITVNAQPDQWKTALSAIDAEQRRIVQYGVRQEELDREITEVRALLRSAVAGQATRRPQDLADMIVGSLAEKSVVTNPAQDMDFFEDAVRGLRAAEVTEALRDVFHGAGPSLFVSSPKPIEGGDGILLTTLQADEKAPVAPPAAIDNVAWPYETFGAPGKVAETRDVTDLDTVFVRFDNGVRLTVKPTKFRDDEVLVAVNIGRGLIDLPKDRQAMTWASGAVIEGGLKQISNEDMERVLAAKLFGASFAIGEKNFVLSGQTRREDLPTEMQVLAAYASEPGWRPEAFQRFQTAGRTLQDQFEATDSGVLRRDLRGLLHSGDKRFTFPSRDEIAHATLADLQAQVGPHLAKDPIEVVVVGDVTVDQATEAVARTFGALAARAPEAPAPADQLKVAFPAPNAQPLVLTHKGRADQAIGYIAWPALDYWSNPQLARNDAILGNVMNLRLLDQLRRAEGVTYSPQASFEHSLDFPGWGYISATVEVPPAKLDGFFADTRKIAADLAEKGPTDDELARAKTPRIDQIKKDQVTNGYWLSVLAGAQTDPRRLDFIRQLIPGTERVTAEDVRKAAAQWLKDDRAWKLEVKPR